MRKWLVRIAIGLGVILGALLILGYSQFGNLPPIPDGERLGDRVTVVKDGYVSCAIVDIGGGKVALVDACNDATATALIAALQRQGRAPADVTDILVTHGHPDHIAGIPKFPNATVHALGVEVPIIEGKVGSNGPLPRLIPVAPTGIEVKDPVADGARIPVGDLQAEAFAMPGHTEGSAAWLAAGVLFFGDAADANTSGGILPAKWLFSDDTALSRASILRVASVLGARRTDVKALMFAHTGVLRSVDALFGFH